MASHPHKIFIIGLPRTGTTSVSVALLEQGLKVAHMAFTKRSFELADALSDAPLFADYRELDQLFPNAKFIYLDREIAPWIASMKMLLTKMDEHLDDKTGRFHPVLKRSFKRVFQIDTVADPKDSEHLRACYARHQAQVLEYFAERNDLLQINISHQGSLSQLLSFIGLKPTPACSQENAFPKLNVGKNVASWNEYKHPNKISSHSTGPEHRKYFDYKVD
jgi:hypothetical protein